MLISIHDVPRYERHLLFCSALSNGRPRNAVADGAATFVPSTVPWQPATKQLERPISGPSLPLPELIPAKAFCFIPL